MRIYSKDLNKLINRLEISLTQEEAEDFYFRINDLANNPSYKDDLIRDDFIEGNVITSDDGRNIITKSIRIFIWTLNNLKDFSTLAFRIITKDKL